MLPEVEYRTSKYVNNGLERDHQYLKQRVYPTRAVKQAAAADLLARGHAFIQNLRNGFSRLTATVPRQVRIMTAWSLLTPTISPALRFRVYPDTRR